MATYTENYGLSLPGQDEAPDIDVINQNMMIIDEALKKASNPPKEIIYKSEDGGFPQTGKDRTLYVDDTISPALMYIWNGSSYVPAGGTGGGSGDDTFDVSFTLLAEGWAGSSAPYAQTASIPGMTSGKAVVYALVSESAQPTAEEQADYQLISGLSQNTDSVTFYADAIPAGDMVIRAFCGAGTEETADLSVIAAPFYAQKDYTIGEKCINEGKLWKFTADKPAGAWDSTKVEVTNVDAELAELQEEVDELNSRGFLPNFENVIKLSFSANETWTATEDCWVMGHLKYASSQGGYDTNITCNGKFIASCYDSTSNAYSPVCIPLKKGTTIITGTYGGYVMRAYGL